MAEDEDPPPIVAVGQMSAGQGEQEARQEDREAGQPEREGLAGDLVDLPADRDAEHLGGDDQRDARDEIEGVAAIREERANACSTRDASR